MMDKSKDVFERDKIYNNEDAEVILNIAAGNKSILVDTSKTFKNYFMISNDLSYFSGTDPEEIEENYFKWQIEKNYNVHDLCTMDTFEFMSKTIMIFDRICVYRFLEHVRRTDVLYFIYLISRVLKPDGLLDIIVPNYKTLAQRILDEDTSHRDFEKEDPHCSIWTKHRIEKFFTLEDRFEIDSLDESFKFDGRDIYIRALLRRV